MLIRGLLQKSKKRYFLLFLALIFFVISFLRFYKTEQLFYFAADEDILALSAKRILIDHQAQFTGFPVPGGLFIGPGFYYIMAAFYFLVRMNPFGLPYVSGFLAIFTTFLVYFVGKTVFEKERVGIIAALIYGFSYLVGVYSHVLTSLFLSPILAVCMYWTLYKCAKSRLLSRNLPFVILGFIISLALQNEGSSFSLLPLFAVAWLVLRFKVTKLQAVFGGLVILMTHLPFLIYDSTLNFFFVKSNLLFFFKKTSILKVGEIGHLNASGIVSSLQLFGQTFSNFLFGTGSLNIREHFTSCGHLTSGVWILSVAIAIICGIFVFRSFSRKAVLGHKIVSLHFSVLLAGLFLYQFFAGRYLNEWTLVVFFPGFVMIIGYFFDWAWERGLTARLAAVTILILFIFVNVRLILLSKNDFGLKNKTEAVKFAVNEVGGRPFYFESLGCNRHGYLYLFWYYGHLPSMTVGTGEFFSPRLIDKNQNENLSNGVIFFDLVSLKIDELSEKHEYYKLLATSSGKFGNIEVLVIKNWKIDI